MSETLLKSQPSFEPPRARLAHLLAQLSELDPEGEKILKLEALLEQKAEERAHTERAGLERSRFEAVPARRLKLEPIPFKAATPAASVIGNVDEAEAETESISNEPFAPVKAYRKQAALSS